MGFLHGIGFLFDFLWRRHLCQHAGQEVMSSHVLSCPAGAQGMDRSRGAPGQSGGAIKASRGYREFLLGVWATLPCSALPIARPDSAAFCSSQSCWVLGRSPFGNRAFALILFLPKKLWISWGKFHQMMEGWGVSEKSCTAASLGSQAANPELHQGLVSSWILLRA